jgi:glycosyltransferase involved in cell wall biosynthesis
VPVGNAEALAAAIERLVADAELALTLGTEGRRTAQSSFTIERFVQTLAAAITSDVQPAKGSASADAIN